MLCRDELRQARATVLKDSESFADLLFAIERLGILASGKRGGLGQKKQTLLAIACRASLATKVPAELDPFHSSADELFELVRLGRNDAMHEGVTARNLASHAAELALLLEEGLVNGSDKIGAYMVKTPIRAELWHPISHVRQQMLLNSFSFLPIRVPNGNGEEWRLISDLALAALLRPGDRAERERRLVMTVEKAIKKLGLRLEKPQLAKPDTDIIALLNDATGRPILVVDAHERLVGIATPFDLL